MKTLLIIIITLLPIVLWGQADSCFQYGKVLNYLKQDSIFQSYYSKVKLKFKICEEVGEGGVSPAMTRAYVAGKLGYDDEVSFYRLDSSLVYPMARKIEKEERLDTNKYILNCLSEIKVKRNPKIKVDFYRKDPDVILVHTERIYKKARHTYGMIHLFFFDDEDNIQKVFDVTWIE